MLVPVVDIPSTRQIFMWRDGLASKVRNGSGGTLSEFNSRTRTTLGAVVPDIIVLTDECQWCAADPMRSSLVLRSTNGDTIS
jgi:hypothetical protein